MVSEAKKEMIIEDFKRILDTGTWTLEEILYEHGISEAECLYYLYEEGYLEYDLNDELLNDKLHEEEMGIISSD